jgi:hypothetical protein
MYYFITQANTAYQGISVAEWPARPQVAAHFAARVIPLQAVLFVSAFAKLRKVTSIFFMTVSLPIRPSIRPSIHSSVRLPTRMEQRGSH